MLGPSMKANWKRSKGGRDKRAFGGKRSEEKGGVRKPAEGPDAHPFSHLCFRTMLPTFQVPCSVELAGL